MMQEKYLDNEQVIWEDTGMEIDELETNVRDFERIDRAAVSEVSIDPTDVLGSYSVTVHLYQFSARSETYGWTFDGRCGALKFREAALEIVEMNT